MQERHLAFLNKIKSLCVRMKAWGYTWTFQNSDDFSEYYIRVYGKSEFTLEDCFEPRQPANDSLLKRVLKSKYNIDFNKSTAAYGQMANDPTQFINNIMKQYTPSEGYKYKQNQLQSAVRNSAASGGFAGTRYDQGNQAELIKGLLGEDMQQYLSNILGTQAQGLSGVERLRGGQERAQTQRLAGQDRAQGLMAANAEQRAERAYSASTELASLLAAALGEQGSLGFHGQSSINANRGARQQNQMNMFSNILGSAMTAGSGGAGGGSFLGNLFGR